MAPKANPIPPFDIEAAAAKVSRSIEDADKREKEDLDKRGKSDAEAFEFPYEEIKNVLAIEQDPLYDAALREWDRKEAYLGARVDRREKASADLVNQIFNIVGFFSVFQGVVLTAVTQLKSDSFATCGVIWFPLVLSSVAAVISIVGVSIKFSNLRELESSIHSEKAAQKEAAKRATILRRKGKEKFRFYENAKSSHGQIEKLKSFHLSWICVVLSLCLFTVLFVLSYFAILCDSFVIHPWKGGLHRP